MRVLHAAKTFRFYYLLFYLVVLLFPANLKGQKFLTDTFYVPFRYDSIIEMRHICISGVTDKRDDAPDFVRYETRRRYLLIPVDQEVYTRRPVAEEIMKGISCDPNGRQYFLELERFSVEKKTGRFASSLYLQADVPVYEYEGDSAVYRGTFFYDYQYFPLAKKETLEESTMNLLSAWHTEFKLGLLSLGAQPSNMPDPDLRNFITDPSVRSLYVNTSAASFIGINWWGLQGEVYFVRPETGKRNHYISGIFRYQNTTEYQSFAIGKQSEHFIFRQGPGWLVDVDFNMLIGFCKWKEIERYEPTLYQLFDFELSSVQSIAYNCANSRGITFRIGLIENLNYVIARNFNFQAGLFFGMGVKF